MKWSITSVVAAVVLTALVSVPAAGQVKIDKKPPGDLNKGLLGGLVINRLEAVRDAKKNNITISGVVANTSPFSIDRVTWTFSKWTGKEWTEISSSSSPGTIQSKQSLTTACAMAPTNLSVKIKFEVRSATTKDSASKEYVLDGADVRKPPGDILTPAKSPATSVPLPKGDRFDAIDPASRVVSLVNGLRAKKGTPTLKSSASLDKIAQRYADQMASKDRLGEVEPSGRDRLSEAPDVFTDWHGQFGVQSGQKDPAAAQVQEWLRSRPYMLSIKVTVIGVGVAKSSTGKIYFCQLFAQP
jgi:uncharacterized protein YkwD